MSLCLSDTETVTLTHWLQVLYLGFGPLPPFMKLLTLASHISENDIQFTAISLLHRCHRQSGLIAEIDASCPHPPSKHIHPALQSHFSMKQQLTLNRYNQQELVIVECSHEIEVTVVKGWWDGGRRNVLTVHYMPDSHIPWEASAWHGRYTSPIWLINLLTCRKVMHYSTPFSKLKSHTIYIMFYLSCLIWCSVFTHSIPMLHNTYNFRSSYSTLIPRNIHPHSKFNPHPPLFQFFVFILGFL